MRAGRKDDEPKIFFTIDAPMNGRPFPDLSTLHQDGILARKKGDFSLYTRDLPGDALVLLHFRLLLKGEFVNQKSST